MHFISHRSSFVPLLIFAIPFAFPLGGKVERLNNCGQGPLDGAGVTSSFTRLKNAFQRHLSELQLVNVWRRPIASSTSNVMNPLASLLSLIVSCITQRTLAQSPKSLLQANLCSTTAFRRHREQCCLTHLVRNVVLVELHLVVSDQGIPTDKVAHHVTEVLRTLGFHDHRQQRHGVICGPRMEQKRQHPPSRQSSKKCIELDSCTASANLVEYGSKSLQLLLQISVVGLSCANLYAVTSPISIVWSRKAVALSCSGLRHETRCHNTQVRLDLSQELRESLLVHGVSRVLFKPELLSVSVAELAFLMFGSLHQAKICHWCASFRSASFARWSVWFISCSKRRIACCVSCNWVPCLVLLHWARWWVSCSTVHECARVWS